MIFLCSQNLLGSIATGLYVISMEDAKLQNRSVEPVFFNIILEKSVLPLPFLSRTSSVIRLFFLSFSISFSIITIY